MDIMVNRETAFAATGGQPFKADQPTMVFIHGGGLDHSVWALQTRYFAYRGRNVLAVDLPGHGRTAVPVLDSIAANADWIIALLDALDIAHAALVGHSMGALVAFDTAAKYPGRVSALALLGITMPMPVADILLDAAQADDPAAFDMVTLWGHSRLGQTGSNRAPGLWMTGGAVSLLARSGPGVLYATLKAADDYKDGLDLAAAIECPTLLVLAARDAMTPAKAAKSLTEAIPCARVITLADCGHMMMSEQPDEVLDALISIL